MRGAVHFCCTNARVLNVLLSGLLALWPRQALRFWQSLMPDDVPFRKSGMERGALLTMCLQYFCQDKFPSLLIASVAAKTSFQALFEIV